MNIEYNQTDNILEITYNERVKNKTIHHKYSGTPLLVQRHPVSDDIIRVYLEGNRPAWLDRVKISNNPVNLGKGTLGWWLSKWKSESNLITTPTVQGAMYMLIDRYIPEEFPELKKRLRDNIEVATMNINYDPSFFNDYGLFYKPEEINGIGGAIFLSAELNVKQKHKEEREDFVKRFNDSRFSELVEALTIPLDYSDEFILSQEEKTEDDEWQEDETPVAVAPQEAEAVTDDLEGEWQEDETPVAVDPQESEAEAATDDLEGEWQDDETPVAATPQESEAEAVTDSLEGERQEDETPVAVAPQESEAEAVTDDLEGEWQDDETPVAVDPQESEAEAVTDDLEGEWQEDESPTAAAQQQSEELAATDELESESQAAVVIAVPELKVADSVNKKSDAMVGQLLLF